MSSNNRRYNIDLPRFMAVCDANYIRLLKLVPDLKFCRDADGAASTEADGDTGFKGSSGASWQFAIVADGSAHQDMVVSITVLEAFRYTTSVEISVVSGFAAVGGSASSVAPQIVVRMYHDAATAEAVTYQQHKGFLLRYRTPNAGMYHRDEKKQINEFLAEWLNLCLVSGSSLEIPEFVCIA